MVVIDIWGGHHSLDHLARYIRLIDDALEISKLELLKGYLVNLRTEIAWGSYKEFDIRLVN